MPDVPRCQKCGRPANHHNVRHPFVGLDGKPKLPTSALLEAAEARAEKAEATAELRLASMGEERTFRRLAEAEVERLSEVAADRLAKMGTEHTFRRLAEAEVERLRADNATLRALLGRWLDAEHIDVCAGNLDRAWWTVNGAHDCPSCDVATCGGHALIDDTRAALGGSDE